jgi:hypothetical protein
MGKAKAKAKAGADFGKGFRVESRQSRSFLKVLKGHQRTKKKKKSTMIASACLSALVFRSLPFQFRV